MKIKRAPHGQRIKMDLDQLCEQRWGFKMTLGQYDEGINLGAEYR